MNVYGSDEKRRANLDEPPPGPPEFQVRRALADMVRSRDAQPSGIMPGMGAPASLGEAGFAAEQAITALAQISPNPARYEALKQALRQAVLEDFQGGPGGGLAAAGPMPMPPPNTGMPNLGELPAMTAA
jgi:hypothetical protein